MLLINNLTVTTGMSVVTYVSQEIDVKNVSY